MKNRLIFSALLMLVIFSGCNTDVLLPDEAAGIKKTAELKSIPFKVDLFAVITEESDGVAYAGNLGGTISHLGELKLENSTFLRTFFEYREGPSVYWEMFGDVTGSNGDLMHYTLWGRYYPVENKYESVVTYNGGTGRFVNVEGYCDISGYIDFTSQLLIMKGEGMISNVGSAKD